MEELSMSLSQENLNKEMVKQVGARLSAPCADTLHTVLGASRITHLSTFGFQSCYASFYPRKRCVQRQYGINDLALTRVVISGDRACLRSLA